MKFMGMKKAILGLMVLIVACVAMSVPENVRAAIRDEIVSEAKQYSYPSVESDFEPGSVIVSIRRECSGLNKTFEASDFPEINVTGIQYLTKLTTSTGNSLVNYGEYHQILKLRLEENSKQAVVDAVIALNRNPVVLYASPNQIISIDHGIEDESYAGETEDTNIEEGTSTAPVEHPSYEEEQQIGLQSPLSEIFEYELDESSQYVIIKKYIGTETKVQIPYNINEFLVAEIAEEAFAGNETITTVTIPKSVQKIGNRAFANCNNLKEVTIAGENPNALTFTRLNIGEEAFADCVNLETVKILNAEGFFESNAFSNDDKLTMYCYKDSTTEIAAGMYKVKHELLKVPEIVVQETPGPVNYYNGYFPYMGDAYRDGEITAQDALAILEYCVRLYVYIDVDMADVDENMEVTAEDALQVLRMVVELEPTVKAEPKSYDTVEFDFRDSFSSGQEIPSLDYFSGRRGGNYWQVIDSVEEWQEFLNTTFKEYTEPSEYIRSLEGAQEYFATLDEVFFEKYAYVVTMDSSINSRGHYHFKGLEVVKTTTESGDTVKGKQVALEYQYTGPNAATGIVFSGTMIPREDLGDMEIIDVTISRDYPY